MGNTGLDLDALLRRAADLARAIGGRRFANRPGKLTQLLHQVAEPHSSIADAVHAPELSAALSLIPLARHQLDEIELGLLTGARRAGLSWSDIAGQLSLGSRQAAEQRFLRLQAVHASGSSERDPQAARQHRRRHHRFAAQLADATPLISRLAHALPEALEDIVYADALEPPPAHVPASWDQLPDPDRGIAADLLTGLFEPHLRAVRAAARSEDVNRQFSALTRLLELLHRHPQSLNALPPAILDDVARLTNTIAAMGGTAPDLVPSAFRLPDTPGPRTPR
ncbi:hypothetical protein [Amycolatopsis sp. NPDC004169]|uniref:hypothetical protein n=1 Tax=Amycolatopsis sp. NPDC004169 TaxID=3154453 RepID=UPI0033A26885